MPGLLTGFPGGSAVKNPPVNAGDAGSNLELGRSPGEGNGNPLQYSCLENHHGQRSLVGCSPRGLKRVTEHTHTHTHTLDFRHHWCRNGACSCLRSWDPLLPSGPLSPSSPDTDTTHPGPSSVHGHHACMRADSLLGPALRWSPSSPTPTPAPLEQGGSRQWRAGGFPPTLASATPPPCTDTHLESCLCTGSQFLTSLIH